MLTIIDIGENDTRKELTRQLTSKAGFTREDARRGAQILLALRQRVLAAEAKGKEDCPCSR